MGAKVGRGDSTLDRRRWYDLTGGQQQGWGMWQHDSLVGRVVGKEDGQKSKRPPGLGPEQLVVPSTEVVALGKEHMGGT